jgi:hypothetical protein
MFTDTYRDYCEGCGARYSLRKAKKKDFVAYISKKESQKSASDFVYKNIQTKTEETKSIPRESEIKNVNAFLKQHPYICVYCWEFSIKDLGYCEKCGSRHSIRKTKKKFFSIYQERREKYLKSLSFTQKPLSKPVLEVSPAEYVKPVETTSTQESWKEKIKDTPPPQIELSSKSSEIKQPLPTEKVAPESITIESQEAKAIPSLEVKEEEIIEPNIEISQPKQIIEKPKEIINFCKFCGLKLTELEKFCQQCGYIIK